jgi:hypothetical protein
MRRDYLAPTCGECGRTFDLLNAEDAEEWAYGHDCEPVEVSTCDMVRVVNGRTWRRLSNGHYALEQGNRSVSPKGAA